MVTIGVIVFFVVCMIGRLYRSRITPLLGKLLPAPIAANVTRAVDAVEDITTHQLLKVIQLRLKREAESLKKRADLDALAAKVHEVVNPAPESSPKNV